MCVCVCVCVCVCESGRNRREIIENRYCNVSHRFLSLEEGFDRSEICKWGTLTW